MKKMSKLKKRLVNKDNAKIKRCEYLWRISKTSR